MVPQRQSKIFENFSGLFLMLVCLNQQSRRFLKCTMKSGIEYVFHVQTIPKPGKQFFIR